MDTINFFLILLCACLVKSNKTAEVYLNGTVINKSVEEICANKTCITKCCPKGTFISAHNFTLCARKISIENRHNTTIHSDYSIVDVYSIDRYHRNVKKTSKNVSDPSYYTVHNKIFLTKSSMMVKRPSDFLLLEDGSLASHNPNRFVRYTIVEPLKFCVDLKIYPAKLETELAFKILLEEEKPPPDRDESIKKYIFTAITLLISCFFLLLTLLVYLLLPNLRTIGGKILIALVSIMALSYLLKAVINLGVIADIFSPTACSIICTLYYFAILSTLFWMNVMSFNLFWTLRGTRKSRKIHRRGENFKFFTYTLYAYGTPLALTTVASIIDNVDVGPEIVKPFFNSCQNKDKELMLYLYPPMAVLIALNFLLFILTVYNIWMTKREVNRNADFRNTKKKDNSVGLFIKLSIIMGASFILEGIQMAVEPPFWLFVIVNAYNVFIGVFIFFLFVFKEKILCDLCVKFNIKCNFVENMQMSQYSRTESSRVHGSTKSNTSQQNIRCDEKPMPSISEN